MSLLLRRSPTRSGNALVLSLGILTMVAAAIAVSTTRGTAVLQEASYLRQDAAVIGAVEAVLAREEMMVISLAQAGDPNAFAAINRNYNSQLFGNCEVRSKIEPVRTANKDRSGNPIAFITNPAPDIAWEAPSSNVRDAAGESYPDPGNAAIQAIDAYSNPYWKTNDSVYLYRISAEARYFETAPLAAERQFYNDTRTAAEYDWNVPGTWKARAQGVRYVAVNKEPLFRYVIFYAQQGPKGDLEFSHGPAINVQGNVHSNGSIYMGAGTEVNRWDAVRPSNGATQLGPDPWNATTMYSRGARVTSSLSGTPRYYEYVNNSASTNKAVTLTAYWNEAKEGRVRVTGVEGIFRLAKPAMYGRFNNFPMAAPTGWSPPTGSLTEASDYNLGVSTPLNSYDGTGGSILLRTFSGGWVNPYRLLRSSNLVTRPVDDSAIDDGRRINGVPLIGYGVLPDDANDARDQERGNKWPTVALAAAPVGFTGFARTKTVGGRVKQLDETLATRPLEGQQVFYPDVHLMNRLLGRIPNKMVVTAADKSNPALSPYLSGVGIGAILNINEPTMQNFFGTYRDRGDDHSAATPVFYNLATSAESNSTVSDFEVPGRYVRYVLDGTGAAANLMKRIIDPNQGFIGWQATDSGGVAITPANMAPKVGLMIRERPVPDFNYWGIRPDGTYFSDRPFGNRDYQPWAYGKHKDTAVWPFTELYVSGKHTDSRLPTPYIPTANAQLPSTDPNYSALVSATNNNRMTNPGASTQTYILDSVNPGRIRVTAAARRGGDFIDPTGSDPDDIEADDNGFFRDNWRFIHLRRNNLVSAVGPVVNMTAANTYFDANTFQAVQTRIQPDAANNLISGGTDERLAGLMIRPVDKAATFMTATTNLGTLGLNGRDPFAALLVSPHRGIVLQRRPEPSRMQWIVVPEFKRFYTGTNDGSGTESAGLGCINAPGQAVLTQSARVPAVAATYSAPIDYSSGVVRVPASGLSSWLDYNDSPTFGRTFSKALGEGTVSQSFTFRKGPWVNRWRWQVYKYWQKNRYLNRIDPAVNGYLDVTVTGAGAGGPVDFFSSMTGTPSPVGWRDGWAGRNFWINVTWPFGPSANPTATVNNLFVANYNTATPGEGFMANNLHRWAYRPQNATQLWSGSNTTWSPNNVWTTSENQLGTNSTVFRDAAFTSAVTFLGSDAAVLSALSSSGISSAINFTTVANPAAPTYTEPTNPTDPGYPAAPGVPAAQPVPDLGGLPLTFAIIRDNQGTMAQPIEYNSYISARGTWQLSPTVPFQRYLNVTNNGAERITRPANPIDHQYVPSIDPGTSRSLRPDYWTGPAKVSASWTDMYDPADVTNGSIVPGTNGYAPAPLLNNGGAPSRQLMEDTQMPYWTSGTNYLAENVASTTRASAVIYNGVFYACLANHMSAAATNPVAAPLLWQRADQVWLRAQKIGTQLAFFWHVGVSAPVDGDWRWREVTEARVRNLDGTAADPGPGNPASRLDIPAGWSSDWMVGPCLQSGHQSNTATAEFTNLRVEDSADTSALSPGRWDWEDWEVGVQTVNNPVNLAQITPANRRTVDNTTKYLCSQYQVFWGPIDITEDFFSYSTDGSGNDANRLATEVWFYNPREFWSQSAWWNEGDLTNTWTALPRGSWLYKGTGTTTAPALPTGGISWVEYAARANVLNMNLGNLQNYLTNRNLAQAAYRWSADNSQGVATTAVLRTRFSGTLYASRYNRYPRNPLPGQVNPWNPDLPNSTLNTNLDATRGVHLADLFTDQPVAPTTQQLAVRNRLVPDGVGARPPIAPPLRSDQFINAVMVSNGASLNWGYQSPAVLGQSNTSIVTPNQLYLWGDLNNNQQTVRNRPTSTITSDKYTPLAVMGDSVTLLSNSWTLANYQRTGLNVSTSKVATWNASTLSQLNGASAAGTTSYRTCILTNNQPTTKYRVFMGEGAPFINTMQYIEDWSGKTMNFTGSLVVLDSCRYTRSFLLQDARTYGRSPFGIMGWHSDGTWNTITGWAGGAPDWCMIGGFGQPTTGNANDASNPFGAPNVYRPPTRNMTFNPDLLTEEGTPPNTPFGVTAAGVAGWTRILR